MTRRCASVAAFLQQAEENLAILAKTGRAEGAPAPQNLNEHLRLASAEIYPSPSRSPSRTDTSLENLRRTPRCEKDDSIINVVGSRPDITLTPRQAWGQSPQCLSARLSSPRVGQPELDDPVRRLELREADAKEQMDIQAKMMLGVDRKIRAFDSRLRAVEAGVAAAVDVASGASSSKSLESRLSVVEGAIIGSKTAAALSPRGMSSSDSAKMLDGSFAQQMMEMQRRVAACAEGVRRDREASRKYAKGLFDEVSTKFRELLDVMERRMLEREERLGEEAQKRAHNIGRDIAGSLMRGPITELVDRRMHDFEERFAVVLQNQLSDFRQGFLHTVFTQDSVTHSMTSFSREVARAAVLDELAVRSANANSEFPPQGIRSDLLRQTTERVAELEARGQGEADTYWTIVQSLEVRVTGLEEELSQLEFSPAMQAAVRRMQSLESDIASLRQRPLKVNDHARLGVFQDPTAIKREAKSSRQPLRPNRGVDVVAEVTYSNPNTLGLETPGLLISGHDGSGPPAERYDSEVVGKKSTSPLLNLPNSSRNSFGLWSQHESVQESECARSDRRSVLHAEDTARNDDPVKQLVERGLLDSPVKDGQVKELVGHFEDKGEKRIGGVLSPRRHSCNDSREHKRASVDTTHAQVPSSHLPTTSSHSHSQPVSPDLIEFETLQETPTSVGEQRSAFALAGDSMDNRRISSISASSADIDDILAMHGDSVGNRHSIDSRRVSSTSVVGDSVDNRRVSSISVNVADVDDILAKHGVVSPASSSQSTRKQTVAALPPSPPSPQPEAMRCSETTAAPQKPADRRTTQHMELGFDEESVDGGDRVFSMTSSEHDFGDDIELPIEV